MEAFAASSPKLFVENHIPLWSPHTTPNNHRRRRNLRLSPAYRRGILHVAAFSAPEPQIAVVGDEGVQPEDAAVTAELRNVRVKFELRRECSFGQQFMIVGDDPMFGLWDPLNAVPLNWSDGHVWALEMDVPCNKVMKYKFIMKVSDEGEDDILWQPGPDRVLETWDTEKTITVCEDWDNPELQTIVEEDPFTNQLSESLQDSQNLKDVIQLEGDPTSHLEEELQGGNGYIVPDKALLQSGEREVLGNGEVNPTKDKAATLGRKKTARLSSGKAPVLVPGLTPLPDDDTEEEEESVGTYMDSSLNISEPYLKEVPAIDLAIPKEGTERWSRLYEDKEQPGNLPVQLSLSVLKNDFRWGLNTVRQFFAKMYTKMMS